ncbi:MAG TPA: response regulator [Nitrospirota bacterium]|nr:response regulator [Nitrospirota bacterium]
MKTAPHKKTVLIVDDHPADLQMLNEMLGGKFDTRRATSGEEAIKKIHKKMPDLVLLDILMPGLDGRHVLKYIRDHERQKKVAAQDRVKIVMTSAMGFPQGGVKALHSQCDAYLTKPVTKENLAEVLSTLGLLP